MLDNKHYKDATYTPIKKGFVAFMQRLVEPDLAQGLGIVIKEFLKMDIHTVEYPLERLDLSPRYRAAHKLKRFIESENERCIGCGLCEKICIPNCIRMETAYDESGRKIIKDYSINLGRCIYCGFCADVCPEIAITHGDRYENAAEQRFLFHTKQDMLTPLDDLKSGKQTEFKGVGSLPDNADDFVRNTPLKYLERPEEEAPKAEEKPVEASSSSEPKKEEAKPASGGPHTAEQLFEMYLAKKGGNTSSGSESKKEAPKADASGGPHTAEQLFEMYLAKKGV